MLKDSHMTTGTRCSRATRHQAPKAWTSTVCTRSSWPSTRNQADVLACSYSTVTPKSTVSCHRIRSRIGRPEESSSSTSWKRRLPSDWLRLIMLLLAFLICHRINVYVNTILINAFNNRWIHVFRYWAMGFQLSRWGYNRLINMQLAINRTLNAQIPLDVQHFVW